MPLQPEPWKGEWTTKKPCPPSWGHYSVSFTMDTYVHSMDGDTSETGMDKMDDLFGISLEISVEQQPYPVLFTVTEEGCKAFAPDFPKIQIEAGTMETALMEAKKQIQKALSQFGNTRRSPPGRKTSWCRRTAC